jgi:transposase
MMDGQQAIDGCPRCRELEARVRALEEQVRILTAALEEAQRAGKRQAAPFRKEKGVGMPKKPGRKPGEEYGTHVRRMPPEHLPATEEYVAALPRECPHCQSTNLACFDATDEQFQTEIQCHTVRRRFVVHRGCCLDCGAPVEGRHPLQTSTATGAAREQLGAQAHALMSVLNKQMGLSHGKVAWLFEKVFHVKINRSTSVRSIERTGHRCEPAYEQIRREVRAAKQVTPDETGWRVGGEKAWLHAFATPRATCYDIDPTRSIAPAQRLLGLDWSGWLVHDGWSVYNQFTRAIHQQCNTHLLHRCHELLELARGGAVHFPRALKALLQKGLATRDRYEQGAISAHGLWVAAGRLNAKLDRLVQRRFTHSGNRRLAKFVAGHFQEILAYLWHPGMDATNYQGEQSIRPAVVNRKVWGGNRTWCGARAQAVLTSVIRTCLQRGGDILDFLIQVITHSNSLLIPP